MEFQEEHWELRNPVPTEEDDYRRGRRRQVLGAVVAVLVLIGLVGGSVYGLFM